MPPTFDFDLVSKARRILAAAARGITPIETVMASPPTYSQGATNANSSIVAASTTNLNGGRFEAGNTAVVDNVGTIILDPISPFQYRPQATIEGLASSTVRRGSKGNKIAFEMDAPAFDIALNTLGNAVAVYVTDLVTGVRARAAPADQATTTGWSYHKWDFGSDGLRRIELLIQNGISLRSINVAPAYSIWRPCTAAKPKGAIIWDSYGAGSESGGTNSLSLSVTDYLAETMGLTDLLSLSRGGTGFINAASTIGSFEYRIDNGDIDISRVGHLDFLIIPASLNDSSSSDVDVQAAATITWQKAAAKQPGAILFGCGPQVTKANPASQSRFDAVKAGFQAAAGADPRFIWLDNSPTGDNWMFGPSGTGNVSRYIGADNIHVTDSGSAYLGRRMGESLLNALRDLAA